MMKGEGKNGRGLRDCEVGWMDALGLDIHITSLVYGVMGRSLLRIRSIQSGNSKLKCDAMRYVCTKYRRIPNLIPNLSARNILRIE